jgi:gluconolactonase
MKMSENIRLYDNRIDRECLSRVIAAGLNFPEGPAFARDGSLWAVELKGGTLVRYDRDRLTRFNVGGGPNGIAFSSDEMLWFCDSVQNSLRRFDPVSGNTTTVVTRVNGELLTKPNDLAFDGHGNLVFTCPGDSRTEPLGYICVLTTDGLVKKISSGKYFPNGLAFKAHSSQLVFAETYKHRLWIADWNTEKCELQNERIWCDTGGPEGPGGPDGIAIDAEGNVFVAVYGIGKVKKIDNAGNIFDEISLIGKNPTNCAFDPSGKFGLVVTEAETGTLISLQIQ